MSEEPVIEHSMSGKRFIQLQTGTAKLTEEEKADGWYICTCGDYGDTLLNRSFPEATFCTCNAKKDLFGRKKAAVDLLPSDKGVLKIGEDEPVKKTPLLSRIWAAVKAFLRGK